MHNIDSVYLIIPTVLVPQPRHLCTKSLYSNPYAYLRSCAGVRVHAMCSTKACRNNRNTPCGTALRLPGCLPHTTPSQYGLRHYLGQLQKCSRRRFRWQNRCDAASASCDTATLSECGHVSWIFMRARTPNALVSLTIINGSHGMQSGARRSPSACASPRFPSAPDIRGA